MRQNQDLLPGISEGRNQLYCGDCLSVLDMIPNQSVDLIYIDPPFYSQRSYEMIWEEEAERFAFEDRWKGGINHYINYLTTRNPQDVHEAQRYREFLHSP